MSTALLIVDYQNDFVSPHGALSVPDGPQCQPVISRLARSEAVSLIAVSRDWHPADHVSFSDTPEYKDYSWPPHCVAGTEGAEFDEILMTDLAQVDKPQFIITKGVTNERDQYSAFEGTVSDAEGKVGGLRPHTLFGGIYGVSRIWVVGLALDYCVYKSALDAYFAGFDTTVVVDATRPVAYETGVTATADMAYRGIDFATADDLLV